MAKNRSLDGATAESGAGVAMGPGAPGFRFAPSRLPLKLIKLFCNASLLLKACHKKQEIQEKCRVDKR
jgi:hypothetical protein